MFRTLLLAVTLVTLAACGTQPVAQSPDVTSASEPPDASCAYPCGQACCTKAQTCDFSTETCSDKCAPNCNGRSCGSDGCDDQCGYCDPGTVCNETAGKCVLCTRACDGKQCGSDGCGGTCGTCDQGFACAADFLCRSTAVDAGTTTTADTGTSPASDGSVVPPGPDAGTIPAADSGSSPGVDAGTNPGPDASIAPGRDASVNPGTDGGSNGLCTPPAPTYNPNFTAAQYCDQWSRVICDRLAECCILSPTTYQDCVDYKTRECDTQDVAARIAAGTVTVNMAAAKACFDAERARKTCDRNPDAMLLPACDSDRIFVANAAVGAKCYRDSDCAGGRCQRTPSTCDGVCVAYTAIGATCSAAAPCDSKTSRCQGTCQAKLATGATCVDTGGCLQTDYCDATNPAKVCVPRHGLGGACVDGGQCEMRLECIGGICREDYSTPVGAACKATSNCVLGSWCKGASAGAGTCATYTKVGGACTAGNTIECGPDEYCASGVCAARIGLNGACSGSTCQWGLTCSVGKCVAIGDLGAACTADAQCRRFLRCSASVCTDALAPVGGACSLTPQCDHSYCASATCTTYNADSQACTNDLSCASGNCETNVTVKACRPKCTY
jgi:hypothetical protein